jgi:4-amino-4-deoxy-L-arabinose transferase-like glycosyltransferase
MLPPRPLDPEAERPARKGDGAPRATPARWKGFVARFLEEFQDRLAETVAYQLLLLTVIVTATGVIFLLQAYVPALARRDILTGLIGIGAGLVAGGLSLWAMSRVPRRARWRVAWLVLATVPVAGPFLTMLGLVVRMAHRQVTAHEPRGTLRDMTWTRTRRDDATPRGR